MTQPVVPWPGGKRRLLKQLYPHFSPHTCYVEPFAGGAAALLMRPEPAALEVLNDIDGELVRLYRCVRFHLDEFVRMFRWSLVSREMFDWAVMERPETLTDIQRAARFFYLQKLAFGARTHGRTFGLVKSGMPRLNLLRIEEELSAAHLRLASVVIENLPWHECVRRYDGQGTLFYVDPPYWELAGYGMDFPFAEYERMAELMKSVQGRIVLSINDHPAIREVFSAFTQIPLQIRYSVAREGRDKCSGELIIKNWNDSQAQLL